jgi:hypothetical protein
MEAAEQVAHPNIEIIGHKRDKQTQLSRTYIVHGLKIK